MKISKHGHILSNDDIAAVGATYDNGLSVRLYDSKFNMVELSNEEVARIISIADLDILSPIVNEKMKVKKHNEMREGIIDDVHYILEKMAKCDDYCELQRVLDSLERITAEI